MSKVQVSQVLSMSGPLPGGVPELSISRDIARRGLIIAPLLVAISGVIWGLHGAYSCGYGVALVLLNFLLAAAIIAATARISLAVMLGGILFGYLLRLGLIFLAVFAVHSTDWISLPALGATIIVTHLGLLVWELRYVSISLAYPGLKPTPHSTLTN